MIEAIVYGLILMMACSISLMLVITCDLVILDTIEAIKEGTPWPEWAKWPTKSPTRTLSPEPAPEPPPLRWVPTLPFSEFMVLEDSLVRQQMRGEVAKWPEWAKMPPKSLTPSPDPDPPPTRSSPRPRYRIRSKTTE